jgi:DNA-binding LacI/PurR family transcriptional regulator
MMVQYSRNLDAKRFAIRVADGSGNSVTAAGQRVTIRDVARAAGVSTATVSQVLNGSRPVADATRQRIERVIAELNYRPNTFARALKTLKSQLVGVVLPDLSNPFYPALVRGVQDRLGLGGYHAVVVNTDADRAQERELIAELVDRQVDGLVLITFTLSSTDYAALAAQGVRFVVIGRADGFDHVHTSDFAAAYKMTAYLLDKGYKSVAHLAGPNSGGGPAADRLSGYRAAMRERGLRGAAAPVVHGEYTLAGGHRAMTELLKSGARARAVFCANDLMALGAIEAARAHGLGVPDDVAVAGFDDIDAASLVRPRLTTVGHHAGELGARAVDLLLDQLRGTDRPPADVVIDFELRKRESA